MSIGETLTQARLDAGLSVEDVSQATMIRSTLIRAIEADEFDPCGGAVYARGHIRSIAGVVGTDPAPLVAEFDEGHGGPPGGAPPVTVASFDPTITARAERRRPNWAAAMIVVLVIVIVAALVPLLLGHNKSPRTASSPPPSPAATQPSQSSPSATPTPTAAPPVVPPGQVTVALRVVSDKSWCKVSNSTGSTLFEGLLYAGQRQVFHDARTLSLVIGNAPVVDLVVNGHDLGTPPSNGSVANVSYTPASPGLASAAG